MTLHTGLISLAAASRNALAVALLVGGTAALAQPAPETQSATNPAPAEQQAGDAAAQSNNPGPGNSPNAENETGTTGPNADNAAAAGGKVEEIVVTAQFRQQNLQDTPLAITAVSGAMMEARSQTNISQVANEAPSVTLKPQGAAYGPSLAANIRGVGQPDFNPALEPGVGLYVDDVYYATLTGSIFDLLDLDRVEILRGPQGTLSGRNSIGGAVKLFSKRPTGSNSGYVAGTYGSRNRVDLRGSADFRLTEGVDARISAVAKKQEGYVNRLDFGCVHPAGSDPLNPAGGVPRLTTGNSCLLAKEGEVDYNAIRGQLRFRPTHGLDINIIGDYTHDDRNTAGGVLLDRPFPDGVRASPAYPRPIDPPYSLPVPPPSNFDINPFSAPIPYDARFVCGKYCNYATYTSFADGDRPFAQVNGRTKFNGWGLSGQVDWDIADTVQLVSITAYRNYQTLFSNDDDLSPLAHSLGRGDLSFHSFSQELRLNGSFWDKKLEYTLGGFYMDQKSLYATFQDLRYAGLPPFVGNDPVNADSKALFAHVAFRPIDPLTLTGGIRYTEDHKDYTYSRRDPTTGAVLGGTLGQLNGKTGNFDGNRVDYRLNAQYEFTNDITGYVQWSTGFKGGGVNPRPFFAEQVLGFGPETLEEFEAGLKTDLFDRHVRLNLAAYRGNYKGIQLSLSNCTAQAGLGFGIPCALPWNAGDARIQGFEVETSIRPVRGMIIDGTLSYLDFKYKSIDPNAGGPGRINGPQFGDYPPYSPKWKWSIGAQYEIPMGDAGSLTPRFDATYQSKLFTNAANRPSNVIEAYTLANARVTWANVDKDLEISAEVTNLFNKYYLLTNFDLTIAGAGVSSGQPGRPREWALTLKKKF